MSELRKYNTGALFYFPLIEDGDADFEPSFTPAAGDAKIFTDKLISTNPTALILGFDSLSELPADGATIDEQGAGTASGVVEKTVIVSGTVGGGDAAGFFFMRSVTGQAWSNNDVIDINGGSTSIADADDTTYDLAATAGLIGLIGNGMYAACLSPTEMTCAQGQIHIVDSATKVVEDQAIQFTTFGNASALMAVDFDDSVRMGLTALPNAAADAAGGLPISDDGGLDIDAVAVIATAVGTDGTNLTEAGGDGDHLVEAGGDGDHLTAIPEVALVTLVTTTTTLTNKTGFSLSTAGILAIWDQATSALTTAGRIGKLLVDNINATISSRMATTHIAATAGVVDNVNTVDGNVDGSVGSVTGAVGSVAGNVDGSTASVVGAVGSVAGNVDGSVASVTARVTANTDQIEGTDATEQLLAAAEAALDAAIDEIAQGVPSATPSVRTAVQLMYMALRNKLDVDTTSGAQLELHNSAGSRITLKEVTDDGTDYSEAKMITGA